MKKAILLIAISLLICFTFCGCDIVVTYDHPERYSVATDVIELDTENINSVEISWVSGDVTVKLYDGNTIKFSEDVYKDAGEEIRLHYYVDVDELKIKFAESGYDGMSLEEHKNLTVYIPKNMQLDAIEVETVSANVFVENLSLNEFEFQSVSGNLKAILEGELVDGKFDSVSGNVELTMPRDSQFKLLFSTVSGSFNSDFKLVGEESEFVCGSKENELEFNSVSGILSLKAAE